MKKNIKYNVIKNLDDYLSVNPLPPKLYESLKGLDYLIYGGYVRDLVAKKYNPNFKEGFKDIDIILLPNSFRKIISRLESAGYQLNQDENSAVVYKHWGAVCHVYTLSKPNEVRIQIASPKPFGYNVSKEALRDVLLEPVHATDIRCCAMAISANHKLIEALPGAYEDCKSMILKESNLASHKINLKERMKKLSLRGWRK